ncbi:MAG: DUF4974 domain-containing protein [Ferruginibacter sp.]
MKEEKYWILLAKLITGEATPEEREMLEELMRDNQAWKTTLENLQDLWNSVPVRPGADTPRNEDAYLMHISRLKEVVPDFEESVTGTPSDIDYFEYTRKRSRTRKLVAYLAMAAILVAGIFVYPLFSSKSTASETASPVTVNEIKVNPGSRTKVQLPDGSQVWVNSGSKLTYSGNFKGSFREVELDGEAYFDVVRDPAHPFIVHTSGIDIRVLGTAFDVKAYKADPTIEATLIHGSIEVINKSQPGTPKILLKPHEKLVYNKYEVALEKDSKDSHDLRADVKAASDAYQFVIKPLKQNLPDSNIVETAWVYNKLSFEEERFGDLVKKMERWYNVKISIESDKLENDRLSGSFVNETVEEALKELQFLVAFRFTISNNEIRIMKK